MKPCILLVGDLTTGFHAVGPFGNYTLAYEHAKEHIVDATKYFVMYLYSPEAE